MSKSLLVILIAVLVLGSVLGCLGCPLTSLTAGAPTPVPTPTRTPKPTFTPGPAATDTPIPTNTPNVPPPTDTPSSPPTPVSTPTPIQPEATVATKVLNIRSGPGVNYGRVRQLKEGDRLKVIGRTEASDWLKILTSDGQEGWVATEFVTVNTDLGPVAVAQAPPPPTPVPATPTPPPPPPTNTPPPQPTATPRPAYRYSVGRLACTPNCGTSGAKGTIYTDRAGSGKVNGIYVKVWADGWAGAWSKQTYNGFWEVLFGPGPRAGKWYAAVYATDQKEQLSEIAEFQTVSEPCAPNSSGCQWAEVDFVGNW